MENLIGQTLNRYQILSLLGEGGMGAVYKAHDVTLQRDVAVKVMYPHFAHLAGFPERFLQEARTAARLDHPGIVQVFDFGHAGEPDRSLLYIVMEYIPGDNLQKMLEGMRAEGRWILLNEAIQLVRQVAQALDYAHRLGILHRDIKPSNIMIELQESEDLPYRPVITDLGLAKLAEGGVLTQEGVTMGTPAYMSPEQAMGQATDARSDVYALGVLLFELATGQLPFPAHNAFEAIKFHGQTPPPLPRTIRPDLPETLERITLKALEKEPTRRFHSAGALAEALKEASPHATAVVSAPSALQQAISLFTQYQASLVAPVRPPLAHQFQAAAPQPGEANQDRLQVLAANQTTRSVLIRPEGMVIGRDESNDLVLDDPKVSRQHARLSSDGQQYHLTDLNSTNGTFLDGRRLLPGIPVAWSPGQTVRIGGAWLRLELSGGGAPPATVRMPEASAQSISPSLQGGGRGVGPSSLQGGGRGAGPPSLKGKGQGVGPSADRRFPTWLIPILIFVCLGLAVAVGLVYAGSMARVNSVTQTAAQQGTAVVAAVQSTDQALTATAFSAAQTQAQQSLTQQAALAATGTADWLAMDSDGDGLTNADELARGTLPDRRDTDEDGLDDGQEINQRNTNPLSPDSDNDGVRDGDEVARGMNPLDPDSDADGIGDEIDPFPLATAEPTPNLPATEQAAALQTAAAAQTAVAYQSTLNAQLAGTAAAIQATSAAATAQMAATLTAVAQRRVAFIYTSDLIVANSFRTLLEPVGYNVDLVSLSNILTTNFNPYKIILVGYDTGNMANWGDAAGNQANTLALTGKPLLALGEGGYAFLGKLGLLIGNPNGAHGNETEVYAVNPAYEVWSVPNSISIPASQIIKVYDTPSNTVVIYHPAPLMGIEPIGRLVSSPNHYSIIRQTAQFTLWGYDLGPNDMSGKGKRLFINLLEYLIP